ncbi:hypothetical protein B0H34DRAFT_398668 [Crassisporium funariophilum]|nr:hypothetical protein B0H34DRAFT_398668 [Crassisporium funariophilum]
MFDRNTRIAKTNYTLGWPANPRDAVTISRSFSDATTLIDISTSLPRSPDEPAYLRPSPPYVRSHVKLFAWCIQHTPPSSKATQGRLRLTCFVQHDLKALWGFGYSTAALSLQLSTMSLSFLKSVIKRGSRVAQLTGWGHGVSIERVRYQIDREALTVDYVILPEEEDHGEAGGTINEVREQRRLTRSVECVVPFGGAGWDVQVTMKASDEEVERLPWSAHAIRVVNNSSEPTSSTSSSPNSTSTFANTTMVVTTSPLATPTQILLRLTHSALPSQDCVLKVKLVIEVSGGTRGLRLNGLAKPIIDVEERDPSSMVLEKGEEGRRMLQDVASAVDWSFRTGEESWATVDSGSTGFSGGVAGAGAGDRSSAFLPPGQVSAQGAAQAMVVVGSGRQERTAAADKSILSKVRRNYIYFSSLLQEPEAKWRRTTESRGVSITQLDSIDPTLVVYRAEATFVGVGLWDLYGAVVSPGARVYWDKQHEDGVLLEDVNELTELWWFKRGGSWPVNGRDSVVLKTVYKSPTTIHVFSFSASPSDTHLFPSIPPPPPSVIRTQTDLQGWAIESLSPNTTLLTLLEQSDPKGWSGKASIPTQMVGTLAGIGEFAIKQGGTPVVTRMKGGRKREVRYEHERGVFRVEYEPDSRRGRKTSTGGKEEEEEEDSGAPAIECEIRCDVDTWASSLDIVVDPPPQGITCLRRHRLSPEGGGLWITFTHDAIFVDDPRLLVIVRRGPGSSSSAGVAGAGASTQGGLGMQKEFSQRGERGMSIPLVNVNGQRVQVDVEEMGEGEVREMMKRKRVKPVRVPLDQPPVLGVVRRRRAELATGGSGGADGDATSKEKGDTSGTEKDAKDKEAAAGGWASAPRISSPLSRFFTYAVDQATTTTQQAVAAISPSGSFGSVGVAELDPTKMPMQYALEALAWTQEYICTKSHAAYLQASSSFPASSSTTSVSSIGPPPPLQAQDDGWTLVADKGMLIQRKLVPEISPTIPVHRGSKVIQGFSAEEILGVITETECRKTWDDRFDAAGSRVLEAFGAGAGTAWVVGKAGFPWRDRGFWVAGVVGRVGTGAGGNLGAQPSLSRRNTDDSSDPSSSSSSSSPSSYPSSSSGTRNAVVYVSASFSPSSPSSLAFSPAKLNPYALPIGRVYIDAWVLETLDPYTKENYAIPSTRCTRLVAVDYKGSLPAAVNGMINAGLVRGVLGVEAYLKGGVSPTGTTPAFNGVSPAAMPMTRLPAAGLVFSERKDLHNHLHHLHHAAVASGALAPMVGSAPFMAWKLRKRDESRVLVETRFDVERRVYRAVVLVRMGGPGAGGTTTTTPVGGTARIEDVKEGNVIAGDGDIDVDVDTEETTPRPSTLSLNPQTRPQHAHTHSHSHSYSHSTSPTKRSRNPFEDALDSSTSDATLPLTSPRPNASTPLLPMPGSMIVSPTFPAGSGSRSPPPINTNTKRSPSAPGIRQRAASSGAGSLHSVGLGLGSGLGVGIGGGMGMGAGMNAHVRGRTTSSVFTVKGEVKVPLDLVVMEVVVDSKMYAHPGDGAGEGGGEAEVGYCVDVKARRRTGGDAIPLSIPSSPPSPTPPTSSEPEPDPDTPPFLYTLHTLPSSPLHSSGLSSSADGTPTRHLLRVTLPTAQYKVSTVRDPLTGEVRKGPERPGWMGGTGLWRLLSGLWRWVWGVWVLVWVRVWV